MHQNEELPSETNDQFAAFHEAMSLGEFTNLIAQYKRAMYEKAYLWSQSKDPFQIIHSAR